MQSDARQFLHDIAISSEAIRTFCLGHTLRDYDTDLMLRSACERQLEIIGEAMTRLRDSHPDTYDRVENAHAIIALRNRLIHGYDSVDSEIVWDIISSKLSRLEGVARRLLSNDR